MGVTFVLDIIKGRRGWNKEKDQLNLFITAQPNKDSNRLPVLLLMPLD
jgi:hypothetical protein